MFYFSYSLPNRNPLMENTPMALFDSLINEAAQKFGLGGKAAPLVSGLLSMMINDKTGGLNGFLDKFRNAGLGDMVTSWIGTGDKKGVSESQVQNALGFDTINNLAQKVGIAGPLAASALSFIIPKAINLLTPNGSVPLGVPASVSSFISAWDKTGVSSAAKQAYSSASKSGGGLSKLWPILAVALLAVVGYKFCTRSHTTDVSTQTPDTAVVQTAEATANPSLSLVNDNGKIKFSGVVANEDTKTQIMDELKASFGADKVMEDSAMGGIKVDPNVKSIEWLPKLKDVLTSFNIPGATLSIDGDSFRVGGNIASAKLTELMGKLKNVLGAGFAVSLLNLDMGALKKKAENLMSASTSAIAVPHEALKAINMNPIVFNSGSSVLSGDSKTSLKNAVTAIKQLPAGVTVQIGGNADRSGNEAQNQRLALARANAVRTYLIQCGINPNQLTAKGYSDLNPVADNDTAEGRERNRRIDFSVIK